MLGRKFIMGDKANFTYHFLIIHENQQKEIKLAENSVVEDVKLKIFEHFNIRPSKQLISGWPREPSDENEQLKVLGIENQHVLWVSSFKTMESATGEFATTDEFSDVDACISFITNFMLEYGEDHVLFHDCSLRKAIVEACFSPVEERKIVALYFHNKSDPFSKLFCPNLIKGDVRKALENVYYFIGWDVSDKLYHNALKSSLENIDFDGARVFIDEMRAALLILYPIENSITVFSILYGKKEVKDIVTTLQEIEKNFAEQIKNELELEKIQKSVENEFDIGSKEFQQLMFDRLGNRDYDSFESNEHQYLKDKIGFAKFGPPKEEAGYSSKEKNKMEETYNKIVLYNNKHAEWPDQVVVSFIYNCLEPLPHEKIARAKKYSDYNPKTDISPIPVFVIRKCQGSENPCRIFVDSDNRVYHSWKEYIENNKLHKCTMVLPADGRYAGDENGDVLLERHLSPSCGIGATVLKGTDIATTIAGLGSGAILIAAMIPAVTIAPIALLGATATGIVVGAYSLGRSIANLVDRHTHGQSLSFANSEARGDYISILAGTLGFAGAGATTAVSQLATRGINIGQGAQAFVNTVNILNLGVNGMGAVHFTYEIVDDWFNENRAPSMLTIVQLSSSILFFGHACYNFRTAGTIIEHSQKAAIENYQDSLRSNRHRKTFNKIMLETIAQNGGDLTKARSEVISAIRHIGNKDETFAILTRNKKLFNEAGVKFSAENGEIKLNGISVDLFEFGAMGKSQRTQFLVDLPATLEPPSGQSCANTTTTINTINTVFELDNVRVVLKYQHLLYSGCGFTKLASMLLRDFSSVVQEKVLRICRALLDNLFDAMDFQKVSQHFSFLNNDPCALVLRFVIDFLRMKMNEYEAEYERQKEVARREPDFNEQHFDDKWCVKPESGQRALVWFERAVNVFVNGYNISELMLRELIQFVMNLITERLVEVCEAEDKRLEREKSSSKNARVACKVCGGYYFSPPGTS